MLAETNSSSGIKNVDLALLRCMSGGSLDPTFGIGGEVVTDFGGPSDLPRALLLVGDTQILVAGHDETGAALVARYWQ